MFRCPIWLPLVLVLAGCGNATPTVTGLVTIDGQAVAQGAIVFIRNDGERAREGGGIVEGRYQSRMPAGTYKVEVTASTVVGKRTDDTYGQTVEVNVTEELIPERYNKKTELRAEIKSGRNTADFTLTSGK